MMPAATGPGSTRQPDRDPDSPARPGTDDFPLPRAATMKRSKP